MSGHDLARRLRALPGLGQTRLVALTGLGTEEDRRQSRAAGFDRHLVKPVELEALRALPVRGGGGRRPAAGQPGPGVLVPPAQGP